jgi:hypothetical protein
MRKVRVCLPQGVTIPDYFKRARHVQSKTDAKIDEQGILGLSQVASQKIRLNE